MINNEKLGSRIQNYSSSQYSGNHSLFTIHHSLICELGSLAEPKEHFSIRFSSGDFLLHPERSGWKEE